MQDLLEESWNAGEFIVKTTSVASSITLVIDMKNMLQTGSNGAVRAIKRLSTTCACSLLIKGVAGHLFPLGSSHHEGSPAADH
jgi:hypothetical protein